MRLSKWVWVGLSLLPLGVSAYVPPAFFVLGSNAELNRKLESAFVRYGVTSGGPSGLEISVFFYQGQQTTIEVRPNGNQSGSSWVTTGGLLADAFGFLWSKNSTTTMRMGNDFDVPMATEREMVRATPGSWDGTSAFYANNTHGVFAPFGGSVSIRYQRDIVTTPRPSPGNALFYHPKTMIFRGLQTTEQAAIVFNDYAIIDSVTHAPKLVTLQTPSGSIQLQALQSSMSQRVRAYPMPTKSSGTISDLPSTLQPFL